jgi:hypothetical protein
MALAVRLTSVWYDLGVFCSHGFVFWVGWIRESYDCTASTVTETQPASQGKRNQRGKSKKMVFLAQTVNAMLSINKNT